MNCLHSRHIPSKLGDVCYCYDITDPYRLGVKTVTRRKNTYCMLSIFSSYILKQCKHENIIPCNTRRPKDKILFSIFVNLFSWLSFSHAEGQCHHFLYILQTQSYILIGPCEGLLSSYFIYTCLEIITNWQPFKNNSTYFVVASELNYHPL